MHLFRQIPFIHTPCPQRDMELVLLAQNKHLRRRCC